MFFSFLFLSSSLSDEAAVVKAYVDNQKWLTGKNAATKAISAAGFLDADVMLFFLRGICQYELGKFKPAIEDLTTAITSADLDEENRKIAYKYRGMSNVRIGKIKDADIDSQKARDSTLSNLVRDCTILIAEINDYIHRQEYEKAINGYKDLLKTCVYSTDFMYEASKIAFENGFSDDFQEISGRAVQADSNDLKILELRGKFFLCENDYDFAKRHLLSCAKRASAGSKCPALNRQNNEFKTASEKFERAVNTSNAEDAETFSKKCNMIATRNCRNDSKITLMSEAMIARSLSVSGKHKAAIARLDELIEQFPNSTDLLLERGDIKRILGENDEANKDYVAVKKLDEKNARAEKAINEIYEEREKEKKCDYYKLLNLSKDFTKNQLRDAVRKAVRMYHPDQFSDPKKKKECEKIMVHVNRANEILSDPQKKEIYDRGEDPDNPGYVPGQQNEGEQQMYSNQNGNFRIFFNGVPFGFNGNPFNFGGGPFAGGFQFH